MVAGAGLTIKANHGYGALEAGIESRPSKVPGPTQGITAASFLTALGCAALPFTKALTVDVGYPLKLYEVLLITALVFWMVSRPAIPRRLWIQGLLPLMGFVFVAIFAYVVTITSPEYTQVGARGGAYIDGATRLAYLSFHILVFVMLATAESSHAKEWIRYWLWGATLSACYSFYCCASLTLIGDAFLLPGLDGHQLGTFGPIVVSRSGTFMEGNFAGLYFLASFALAQYCQYRWFAILALAALLLTKSTSAYLGLGILFTCQVLLSSANPVRKLAYVCGAVGATAIALFFALAEGKFEFNAGASAGMRLNEAMTGLEMYASHPWIGVGLGQYGFMFSQYEWSPLLSQLSGPERRIANNVYIEFLAETGSLGLGLMILFWTYWIRSLWSDPEIRKIFAAFGIGMFAAWMAYPTFNMTYVWCMAGISLALSAHPGDEWVSARKWRTLAS